MFDYLSFVKHSAVKFWFGLFISILHALWSENMILIFLGKVFGIFCFLRFTIWSNWWPIKDVIARKKFRDVLDCRDMC
jgi:hypothetical protein